MREPTAYEIVVETHGNIIPFQGMYDDLDEMLAAARELIVSFREEQDAGSWKVFLMSHWCADRSQCECWNLDNAKPVAAYQGITVREILAAGQ